MISHVANRKKSKNKPRAHKPPPTRRRSSHLAEKAAEEVLLEQDAALKAELSRMETDESQWKHPIGFNLLSALRILNAPFDPVFTKSGHWIQPEELEDIPTMFDSYLNVNCLYYSLVGVLAIETSMSLEVPGEDAPEVAKWLLRVARFCWAANGVWSMAAVVAAFHILWSIHTTPDWAKRKFMFENSKTLSVVYVLGAPNFALMMIGTITGTIGNVLAQPNSYYDAIFAAAGLGVGCSVSFIFILCSGSLISQTIRPWKHASDQLASRSNSGNDDDGDDFFDNDRPEKVDDVVDYPQTKTSKTTDDDVLDNIGVSNLSRKLSGAGLDIGMLQKVNNDLLLDQLLQGADVDRAGDRLKVILFLREALKPIMLQLERKESMLQINTLLTKCNFQSKSITC